MNLPPASHPGSRLLAGREALRMPQPRPSGGQRAVAIARANATIERCAHTMRAIAAP